jgi:dihydrofolate reductase
VNGQVFDEFMATGAVVAGRGTFEPAGGWGGDHHDGVPIFILTRQEPDVARQWPLVAYVTDDLFEDLGPEHIGLERTRILEGEGGVTHLHYRVRG